MLRAGRWSGVTRSLTHSRVCPRRMVFAAKSGSASRSLCVATTGIPVRYRAPSRPAAEQPELCHNFFPPESVSCSRFVHVSSGNDLLSASVPEVLVAAKQLRVELGCAEPAFLPATTLMSSVELAVSSVSVKSILPGSRRGPVSGRTADAGRRLRHHSPRPARPPDQHLRPLGAPDSAKPERWLTARLPGTIVVPGTHCSRCAILRCSLSRASRSTLHSNVRCHYRKVLIVDFEHCNVLVRNCRDPDRFPGIEIISEVISDNLKFFGRRAGIGDEKSCHFSACPALGNSLESLGQPTVRPAVDCGAIVWGSSETFRFAVVMSTIVVGHA